MNENYISILKESLEKKVDILRQLQLLSKKQSDILSDNFSSVEDFEENLSEKEILIERLSNLDSGFDNLFEKVKKELEDNRARYADDIALMQELIRDITDRSVALQVLEKKNYELAKAKFSGIRTRAREMVSNDKAANAYMTNMKALDSQFMDKKK